MTRLGIGEMPGTLTTAQCAGGLLRGAEPFILEKIVHSFKLDASRTDVSTFVEKHKENLTVSVRTEEVGKKDALRVSIYMGQALTDDVLAVAGLYFTEIDTDTAAEGWKDWFKQQALKQLTVTASSFIRSLFKDGQLDIAFRVTSMWTADLLRAELLADKGKYVWAYVKTFNFLYGAYLRVQKKGGEYKELTMEQINSKLTAQVRAKIHG